MPTDHDGIRIGNTINGTEVVQYVVDKNRPYAQVLEEEHTRGGLSATTSYVYGDALISAATEGARIVTIRTVWAACAARAMLPAR